MGIFLRLKSFFGNLSSSSVRRLIAAAVILCISVILSLPALNEDLKQSRLQKVDNDTIKTSSALEQGMDEKKLDEGADYLGSTDALSFLVVRHNKLVLEKYYSSARDNTYNVYSVTKSFVSALTGIAIEQGALGGIDDPVLKYLPDKYKINLPPGWKDVRIKHLLTMTPGFLEDFNAWTASDDYIDYTLKLPLKYKPGEKFQYANSASHLLSFITANATGINALAYAKKNLFEPMGFANASWAADPKGFYTGYANMFLRARDMAKFGCLYLNGGKWDGKQLVPEEWVRESTRVQYDFNTEDNKNYENGYGFKWWISGETGHHMFSAKGYGGQYIDVIPDLDLVVVITSIPDTALSVTDEMRNNLLDKYIIPSITDK